MAVENGKRWNHNIHYHPRILRAVPAGARRALDIGCGEGMLARGLRRAVPHVTGIDLHAPSVDQAREQS
ncbi:class I SAM-dependent methyltransferase [Spongiactinospora gelatinilytica]|uniref:class I SAM-dependent methyltransferase n=1 Tax=Spongiactinospora gelatinilytica TaxID=2666298 RepID=UPI001F2D97FE|nr:class I SAM-dependent methyltransferase [Spongiactinospora gelatinilytica]